MDDVMLGYIARSEAIESIIKYLSQSPDPNDEDTQITAQEREGIWLKDMTTEETDYIVNQVNKKWSWYH